ncbi:uncharacterized protein [Nicotiana sylvestris]|uniref:uncharacterized protein n=1 Tax=Nicotiana sylvestris TaxID=4096 RepID=UPI00388CC349
MAEDCELWYIICDGPYVPTRVLKELPFSMAKTSKEYTEVDKIVVEKNFCAKKILVYGIGPKEYNRISTYDIVKEIWEALQIVHEGTTQVKQSKIGMLTAEYEHFKMRDDESIQDMHTRFTSIINELHSLDEIIPRNKLEMTVEELIENLKTRELKKKINSERTEPKREKNLVLKADYNDSSEEDSDMAYLTKIFQKMVERNGEMLKRDISIRPRNWDLCYKCGKPGHFMKDCPLLKQEFSKNHHEKIAKTNLVPVKDFKRKRSADKMIRQALAPLRDSSSESEDEPDIGDSSMMAVEGEKTGYDSTFALMSQSDDDEDNGNKDLVEDRDSLTLELGESEQTRDDLVAVVTDHKKTIKILRKEKSDMLAEVTDLRETIVKPWTKSKPESSGKGKEIASEEHIRLKNEGVGFQREKTPHNPHSKYVTISDNWSCTRCGNTGCFKEDVQAKNQPVQKNKVFAKTVITNEGPGNSERKRPIMVHG